jgi:hypothetical protein
MKEDNFILIIYNYKRKVNIRVYLLLKVLHLCHTVQVNLVLSNMQVYI